MGNSKGKILWIDDEIELLKPHIFLLEQKGYEVDKASNGEDGIELARINRYDLIFLDETMIGITGIEALPRIKEVAPASPVVMVTKNEAESLMEEAIGKKIDDYLTKPVNPAQIIAAVKKFLDTNRIKQERLTQDYLQGFNEITRRLYDPLDWQDWKEIYYKLVNWSMEIDKHPQLGFNQTLQDQWRECNAAFSKFIENNYIDWIHNEKDDNAPMFSNQVVEKRLLPLLQSGDPVFFFVVDCMRLDQWLEMEELLKPYYSFKKDCYSSILPTATPYARNSIFAGLFPMDIKKQYPQYWASELNTEDHKQNAFEKELLEEQLKRKRVNLKSPLTYIKIHDTEYGKKIEADIMKFARKHLTSIVINAVDMIAHSRSDYAILKEIAPDESAYRSLTRSWFTHSSLFKMLKMISGIKNVKVLITTDHGSIRCMRGVKVIGDRETTTCLRYKFGKNVKAEERHAMQVKNPEDFRLPNMGLTVNNIIAKEDYYFVYPTDFHQYMAKYRDSFQHGGISLEEMIVPIIELEPR
jgi:CheY-like chemotaxis protein